MPRRCAASASESILPPPFRPAGGKIGRFRLFWLAMLTFRARHLATMTGPVIDDGCVIVEGDRVIAVGAARDLKPSRIDHDIDGLLMPGLVNAHTHLELTNVPRPQKPGTFQDWLLTTMRATRNPDPVVFRQQREAAVREGIAQCLRFGVTAVGDITSNVDIVRPILAAAPIRSISYGECLGLGPRRERFEQLLSRAVDPQHATSRMQVGVSPHAPYTVGTAGYRAAINTGLPWTTHLAESSDEGDFVFERRGSFRTLYEAMRFDPGASDSGKGSVIAWLAGILDEQPFGVLAHVNYCTDEDLQLLVDRNATVAYCPRTHDYFGHPPHRWREMIRRGVNVCVGTDSCASSPDLNLVDDLRLMYRQSPDVDPQALWDTVTFNAAMVAADGSWRNGILHPSSEDRTVVGDFCAWPTRSVDPLREILETPSMLPSALWIGGSRWSN